MLGSAIVIWSLVLIAGTVLLLKRDAKPREALRVARGNALFMAPRIPLALLGAGFLSTLVPEDSIAPLIGPQSGWTGVVVATLVGSVIPSGPMVSFPLAIALVKAGAGWAQTISFLTAWSVLALHRVLVWEIPVVGAGFAARRIAASWFLPFLSGSAAGLYLLLLH